MKTRQEQVKVLRKEGLNYLEIAKRLGVQTHSVRRTLQSIGCSVTQAEIDAVKADALARSIMYAKTDSARKARHSENVMPPEKVTEFVNSKADGFTYAGGYTNSNGTVCLICNTCGSTVIKSCVTLRHNKKPTCPNCQLIQREQSGETAESRRSARLRSSDYDSSITLTRLIVRDQNICWLCGQECNSQDFVRSDNGVFIAGNEYPSIDHVKPIAKGGTHSWDNVRLAHRLCNSIKGDKIL